MSVVKIRIKVITRTESNISNSCPCPYDHVKIEAREPFGEDLRAIDPEKSGYKSLPWEVTEIGIFEGKRLMHVFVFSLDEQEFGKECRSARWYAKQITEKVREHHWTVKLENLD